MKKVNNTLTQEKSDKLILGLIGRAGAGKTEFFKIIKDRFASVEVFSTGRILKEIIRELGIEESRANMVLLSRIIREKFGENALSNILKNQINNSKSKFIIIDGIRGEFALEVVKRFKQHEFIYIDSSIQDRYHRTVKRNEKMGESNFSEEDFIKQENAGFQKNIDYLKSFSSWEISNNGDWNDYKNKVEGFFDKIVKKYEDRS